MTAILLVPPGFDLASTPRTEIVLVRSADALRNAVRQFQVRPTTLDASGLDRVPRLDETHGALEVQAATRWAALADWPALATHGLRAFSHLEGLPATVGGAFAENAAGPDGMPVAAHVRAFVLVTPDGELRRVDRASHPDLFRLVAGGQDLFGMLAYPLGLSVFLLQRGPRRRIAATKRGCRAGPRRARPSGPGTGPGSGLRNRAAAATGTTGTLPRRAARARRRPAPGAAVDLDPTHPRRTRNTAALGAARVGCGSRALLCPALNWRRGPCRVIPPRPACAGAGLRRIVSRKRPARCDARAAGGLLPGARRLRGRKAARRSHGAPAERLVQDCLRDPARRALRVALVGARLAAASAAASAFDPATSAPAARKLATCLP